METTQESDGQYTFEGTPGTIQADGIEEPQSPGLVIYSLFFGCPLDIMSINMSLCGSVCNCVHISVSL